MTHRLISSVIAIPILVQCHPRGEVHEGSPPETWGPAVRIAQPQMVAQDSDFTELAIDEAGNAIAVWAHGVKEGATIYAAHYRVGPGWEGPHPLHAGRMSGIAHLQIATDTVGWSEHDGLASHLYATRYTAEQGWATPVRLDQGTGDVRHLRLTSDGPDTRLAAWVTAHDYSRDVVVRAAHAGTWQPPVLIDTDSGSIVGLDLAGLDGRLVVVWSRWADTRYRIIARRYVETSGWTPRNRSTTAEAMRSTRRCWLPRTAPRSFCGGSSMVRPTVSLPHAMIR